MKIPVREFGDCAAFAREGASMIGRVFGAAESELTGVILPGGQTPLPIYNALAARPPHCSDSVRIFLSDERVGPAVEISDRNLTAVAALARELGVGKDHLLGVRADLAPENAAADYSARVRRFFGDGGRIALTLLGIGSDGHTASLFNMADLEAGVGEYAIAVRGRPDFDRVSLTPAVFSASDRVVFLAAGAGKRDIVAALSSNPDSIPAGIAVCGAKNVEIWYCRDDVK